jgi:hypothetical protein
MVELTRDQVARRQAEFPQLIREISWNNTIVYRIIELYSYGGIVSKEEAYCQMVKELSVSYDEMTRRLVNEAHMKTILFTNPK